MPPEHTLLFTVTGGGHGLDKIYICSRFISLPNLIDVVIAGIIGALLVIPFLDRLLLAALISSIALNCAL